MFADFLFSRTRDAKIRQGKPLRVTLLRDRPWCSCETRNGGSKKHTGWWVVSIQRCLWLCRSKVAARYEARARGPYSPLHDAQRVEDPTFVRFIRRSSLVLMEAPRRSRA